MLNCSIEPSYDNLHYDNYCCQAYDALSEEEYQERVNAKAWETQEIIASK